MAPQRFPWRRRQRNKQTPVSGRQRAISAASEKTSSLTDRSVKDPLNEKLPENASPTAATSGAKSSRYSPEDETTQNIEAQRIVRTVPAWVRDADEDDVEWGRLAGLLPSPDVATVAQHNHTPSAKYGQAQGLARSADRYVPGHGQPHVSRWVTFARASAYPRELEEGERVSAEWLNRNFGDYSTPWLAGLDDEQDDGNSRYHAFQQKRKAWYKRTQDTILKNPLIPLAFRLTVFMFSAVALSLGGSIHHYSDKDGFEQGPSAEMAIIVDVIAMVYTVYITVDEYVSKPLGLRSIRAKLRLMFLDLFFIIFEAANLALAFESLSSSGQACRAGNGTGEGRTNTSICSRQKALASVLLIALIAWLLTFAVSILRLVERVAQG